MGIQLYIASLKAFLLYFPVSIKPRYGGDRFSFTGDDPVAER